MVHRICIIFAMAWTICGSTTSAQSIPGADDPRLREAAYSWLEERDILESIEQIGQIASEGNLSAQMFANRLYRSFSHRDFPLMARDARLTLFRGGIEPSNLFFSPFHIDRDSNLWLSAHRDLSSYQSADDWIAAADTLLAAGMRQQVVEYLEIALANFTPINMEVALFAEPLLTPSDNTFADLHYFFFFEQAIIDFALAPNRAERWDSRPWSEERERRFLAALQDGRWSAIRLTGLMLNLDPELDFPGVDEEWLRRISDIRIFALFAHENIEPPTQSELAGLGEILLRDADLSPYLRPFRSVCSAYCGDVLSECMGAFVSMAHGRSSTAAALEPIIAAEDYFNSDRAGGNLLHNLQIQLENGRGRHMPLPTCLLDAAAHH